MRRHLAGAGLILMLSQFPWLFVPLGCPVAVAATMAGLAAGVLVAAFAIAVLLS